MVVTRLWSNLKPSQVDDNGIMEKGAGEGQSDDTLKNTDVKIRSIQETAVETDGCTHSIKQPEIAGEMVEEESSAEGKVFTQVAEEERNTENNDGKDESNGNKAGVSFTFSKSQKSKLVSLSTFQNVQGEIDELDQDEDSIDKGCVDSQVVKDNIQSISETNIDLKSFLIVKSKDESKDLTWPKEMIQYTGSLPAISFSCNPLYFDFTSLFKNKSNDTTKPSVLQSGISPSLHSHVSNSILDNSHTIKTECSEDNQNTDKSDAQIPPETAIQPANNTIEQTPNQTEVQTEVNHIHKTEEANPEINELDSNPKHKKKKRRSKKKKKKQKKEKGEAGEEPTKDTEGKKKRKKKKRKHKHPEHPQELDDEGRPIEKTKTKRKRKRSKKEKSETAANNDEEEKIKQTQPVEKTKHKHKKSKKSGRKKNTTEAGDYGEDNKCDKDLSLEDKPKSRHPAKRRKSKKSKKSQKTENCEKQTIENEPAMESELGTGNNDSIKPLLPSANPITDSHQDNMAFNQQSCANDVNDRKRKSMEGNELCRQAKIKKGKNHVVKEQDLNTSSKCKNTQLPTNLKEKVNDKVIVEKQTFEGEKNEKCPSLTAVEKVGSKYEDSWNAMEVMYEEKQEEVDAKPSWDTSDSDMDNNDKKDEQLKPRLKTEDIKSDSGKKSSKVNNLLVDRGRRSYSSSSESAYSGYSSSYGSRSYSRSSSRSYSRSRSYSGSRRNRRSYSSSSRSYSRSRTRSRSRGRSGRKRSYSRTRSISYSSSGYSRGSHSYSRSRSNSYSRSRSWSSRRGRSRSSGSSSSRSNRYRSSKKRYTKKKPSVLKGSASTSEDEELNESGKNKESEKGEVLNIPLPTALNFNKDEVAPQTQRLLEKIKEKKKLLSDPETAKLLNQDAAETVVDKLAASQKSDNCDQKENADEKTLIDIPLPGNPSGCENKDPQDNPPSDKTTSEAGVLNSQSDPNSSQMPLLAPPPPPPGLQRHPGPYPRQPFPPNCRHMYPGGDRMAFGDRPPYPMMDRPRFMGGERPRYMGDRPPFPRGDMRPPFMGNDGPPFHGNERPRFHNDRPPFYGNERPPYPGDRMCYHRGERPPFPRNERPPFGGGRPPYPGGDRPPFPGRFPPRGDFRPDMCRMPPPGFNPRGPPPRMPPPGYGPPRGPGMMHNDMRGPPPWFDHLGESNHEQLDKDSHPPPLPPSRSPSPQPPPPPKKEEVNEEPTPLPPPIIIPPEQEEQYRQLQAQAQKHAKKQQRRQLQELSGQPIESSDSEESEAQAMEMEEALEQEQELELDQQAAGLVQPTLIALPSSEGHALQSHAALLMSQSAAAAGQLMPQMMTSQPQILIPASGYYSQAGVPLQAGTPMVALPASTGGHLMQLSGHVPTRFAFPSSMSTSAAAAAAGLHIPGLTAGAFPLSASGMPISAMTSAANLQLAGLTGHTLTNALTSHFPGQFIAGGGAHPALAAGGLQLASPLSHPYLSQGHPQPIVIGNQLLIPRIIRPAL